MEPIVHERAVRSSADDAFRVYTERIGEWWDARYSANADTFEDVTIEPRVGGRVSATHSDLGRHDWGEVTVWEPGRRLVHTFTLAQDADHPSEVAVRFADIGDASSVRLEHGGWNEANVVHRQKFGDWPVLLDRFAALVDD